MKKTTLVIAAFLLALSTISVSCKKQDDSAENRKENSPKPFYRPPKVDDMNAYLEGFIQKMKTRGTEESLELEDAAWHLSSVANHDFGDDSTY